MPLPHGSWPAPTVDLLLADDPDLWLAAGPLKPDLCDCEALCECDRREGDET